jgi:hypothetical protein
MKLDKQRRDFPGRRWLTIVLRSLHLAGVVLLGTALLSGGDRQTAAMLMFATGATLYTLELWSNPAHFAEISGVFIPLKLLVVLAMVLYPERALPLFWLLLLASSIVSHAPGSLRHRRIWG